MKNRQDMKEYFTQECMMMEQAHKKIVKIITH